MAVAVALAYALFERSARGSKTNRKEKARKLEMKEAVHQPSGASLPQPTYGFGSAWAQLVSLTAFEMSLVFKSIAYGILLLLALAFSILLLAMTGEIYGTPVLLVTRVVITALLGTFELVLHKRGDGPALAYPRGETATHWITMGMDPDLDQCAIKALREMIALLGEKAGLSHADAYMLCSLAGDLHVTQTVNGSKGVHMMMQKSFVKA